MTGDHRNPLTQITTPLAPQVPYCKICLRKNQKKIHGAKACKAGLVPQWLTDASSGQDCAPENSELLETPSDTFSDIVPLNVCDNPRQDLNNLFNEWKQSKPQLSPASSNVKTFDPKSSHSYEDFIANLKVKKKVILLAGYKKK